MKKRKKVLPVVMVLAFVGVLLAGPAVMALDEIDDIRDLPVADNGDVLEIPMENPGADLDTPALVEPFPGEGRETGDEAIERVLAEYHDELMAIEGVTGVSAMDFDGEPSIIVFVAEDAEIDEGLIPGELDGYPVVVEVDYEVSIMPFGAENGELSFDEEEAAAGEEAEPDEDAGGETSIWIYVAIGAVIVILLIVMTRKGS